ncbi:MAG: class I SAM-dependent methyltransferase [Planctomycetota bacterium]
MPTKTKDKARKKNKKTADKPTLAERADRYALYGLSVQEPSNEAAFFTETYKALNGREPRILREDFCGTHAVCCEWVKLHEDNVAYGVDLDPEPLAWGKANLQPALSDEQRGRIKLYEDDVRSAAEVKADVLAAQNFSFFLFKTRDAVRGYFAQALANLADGGIMVMDMMGGSECYEEEHEDIRTIESDLKGFKKFKYIWEQKRFNPITADALFHIHFRFKDGSELDKAFTYDWRFWTIPEVNELLLEAGFSDAAVYWEETDDDGDETGEFTPAAEAPADPSWIAYIVARK